MQRLLTAMLINAARGGDADSVRRLLEQGADPNGRDSKGRTVLIRAVRSFAVESSVIDALLDAGADPAATDSSGHSPLDHARRHLETLGPGPDPVHRSRSIDENGNLRLSDREQQMLGRLLRTHPDSGDTLLEQYIQKRRQVALHQWMPRRELEIIIRRLEEQSSLPPAGD